MRLLQATRHVCSGCHHFFSSPLPHPVQEPCLANAEERTTQLLENAELGVQASWLN
jgi:hypothetical protein